MIAGVFFKTGDRFANKILDFLESFEEELIRGLGRVFVYSAHRTSAYFVPTPDSFSYNANRYERSFLEAIGRPSILLSLLPSESVTIYPTGNVTSSNPLLIPTFSPRRVSPVEPDLLGTLWLALRRKGLNPEILAVHDPPSTLNHPHLVLSFPGDLVEDVLVSLLASLRRKKVFVPHVTVGRTFAARYFYPLIEKRRVPAYHVPYHWVHFLDEELFEEMKRKGNVRSILVEKGLVLPGELPHKEV